MTIKDKIDSLIRKKDLPNSIKKTDLADVLDEISDLSGGILSPAFSDAIASGNYTAAVGADGKQVLTNILDAYTGEATTFKEVVKYADDTSMDDTKADGVIYIKKDSKYFVRDISFGVNVKWFGVKGNGTDETALINSVFNAAPANSTVIFEANKVYNITDKIILNKPVNIIGNGARFNKTSVNG